MAKTFRANAAVRIFNSIITFLLRIGVKMGPMILLSVKGRKSGKMRTTPIAVTEIDGDRVVIAPYGAVNWVRNLRAEGHAWLTRGRKKEYVLAEEMSIQEAALVLKHILPDLPSFLVGYFDVTPDASSAEFEREAQRHPVFRFKALASAYERPGQGVGA
jgi:deazaflavin-dependent oxidoreductase (nitroreductase family)